jgi:hypothetical protein
MTHALAVHVGKRARNVQPDLQQLLLHTQTADDDANTLVYRNGHPLTTQIQHSCRHIIGRLVCSLRPLSASSCMEPTAADRLEQPHVQTPGREPTVTKNSPYPLARCQGDNGTRAATALPASRHHRAPSRSTPQSMRVTESGTALAACQCHAALCLALQLCCCCWPPCCC